MSTWTPAAAPKLMYHSWVPPVDVDVPPDLRSVAALEAALQQRRDQAKNLRVPNPMGLCIAAPAAAAAVSADDQLRDRASHVPNDDRMEDVDSDAMSASDFDNMSHASLAEDPAVGADAHAHAQQHHSQLHADGDDDEEEDDDDDDDDLARFL
ncbi:unnamed protein product [Agarophyton chilense]